MFSKAVCICAFVILTPRMYFVQSLPEEYSTKSTADTANDLENSEEDFYAEHDFLKYFGAVPSDGYDKNEKLDEKDAENNTRHDKENEKKVDQQTQNTLENDLKENKDDKESDFGGEYYADHEFLNYLSASKNVPQKNKPVKINKEQVKITEDPVYNENEENVNDKENIDDVLKLKINNQKTLNSEKEVNIQENVNFQNSSNRNKSKYAPIINQGTLPTEYARPRYHFAYGVNDPTTGDKKHHYEKREGDEITGQYFFVEADGHVRTVKYKVNKHSGFNAVVLRD